MFTLSSVISRRNETLILFVDIIFSKCGRVVTRSAKRLWLPASSRGRFFDVDASPLPVTNSHRTRLSSPYPLPPFTPPIPLFSGYHT